MDTSEMFEKSLIVTGHPDDEVLWFSSILDKVNETILCFSYCKSKPHWGIGRQKSLLEYPVKKISCLGIDESESFNDINWYKPLITRFGLKIFNKRRDDRSDEIYKENYYKIKQYLENKLIGYHNVFTHNPWGEYGHEEHVQIYRVVKELQKEMKFNLWFSNYCSNKSYNLMLNYISGFNAEYVTLETNKILANTIKDVYKKNECWTWYADWEWFNEESFMKDKYDHYEWLEEESHIRDKDNQEKVKRYGHIFPINFIKIEYLSISNMKSKYSIGSIGKKLLRKIVTAQGKNDEENIF